MENDIKLLRATVEQGGGRWVGVQEALVEGHDTLVLFDNPQTNITLALPVDDLTVVRVKQKVEKNSTLFSGGPIKISRKSAVETLSRLRQVTDDFEKLITEEKK